MQYLAFARCGAKTFTCLDRQQWPLRWRGLSFYDKM